MSESTEELRKQIKKLREQNEELEVRNISLEAKLNDEYNNNAYIKNVGSKMFFDMTKRQKSLSRTNKILDLEKKLAEAKLCKKNLSAKSPAYEFFKETANTNIPAKKGLLYFLAWLFSCISSDLDNYVYVIEKINQLNTYFDKLRSNGILNSETIAKEIFD